MKNIIVPTDYSDNAANAMHYAAALARAARARLILYHAFPYPVITDVPVEVVEQFVDSTVEDHLHRLGELKAELGQQYGIEIACVTEPGAIALGVQDLAARENADLAVMGLRGDNPALNVLMGSTTAEIMRRGKVPVLIVPLTARFKTPERILFACDTPQIDNAAVLRPLKDLATLSGAEIEVIRIDPDLDITADSFKPHPSNLEEHLGKFKHTYTFEVGEDVRESILEAIGKTGADILTMIPHRHSLWSYLFDKSNTLGIALHTTVPVLALAEKVGDGK